MIDLRKKKLALKLIQGKEKCIFGEEAFRRVRLGVVLQMTSIGIPMIWMGEEIGE